MNNGKSRIDNLRSFCNSVGTNFGKQKTDTIKILSNSRTNARTHRCPRDSLLSRQTSWSAPVSLWNLRGKIGWYKFEKFRRVSREQPHWKTSNGCEGRVQGNMTRSLIITLITRVVTFHNFRISKVRLACRQNYSELGGDMSKLHVIGKM